MFGFAGERDDEARPTRWGRVVVNVAAVSTSGGTHHGKSDARTNDGR